MRVERAVGKDLGLLAYPYPYRAWLCLSNDPDNTVEADWRELHELIWEELALPFADALFIRSFHEGLPDQVNLEDHPFIAAAHPHDTIHSWGDYTFTGRGFDRADAVANLEILERHGLRPRVWIDHSYSSGNLLHGAQARGGEPSYTDLAGHTYVRPEYTLDLLMELGVRYVWDGHLTEHLGQDAPRPLEAYYRDHSSTRTRARLKALAHRSPLRRVVDRMNPGALTYTPGANAQYFPHMFPDGSTVYCFRRYGYWDRADIDALHDLIKPHRVGELVRREGTCIVYTHLGKRPADRLDRDHHVPADTRTSLAGLKERYEARELMLSSVSRLLDYLVLRDHLVVEADGTRLDFRPDGIRFHRVTADDLAGFRFSFVGPAGAGPGEVRTESQGAEIRSRLVRHSDCAYSVEFEA